MGESEREKPRVMPLDRAVRAIAQHRAVLHYDAERELDLWSPGHKLPITLRRSVTKYKQELLQLLNEGDSRLCASPSLHKPSWKHVGNGRFQCQICKSFVTIGLA